MTVERSGQVECPLVFGLREVGALEELRGEDDLRASLRGFTDQRFDARDVFYVDVGFMFAPWRGTRMAGR